MAARRAAIALGTFVIAWLATSAVARWLFGSGNVLVWVVAAVVAGITYAVARDHRLSGWLG